MPVQLLQHCVIELAIRFDFAFEDCMDSFVAFSSDHTALAGYSAVSRLSRRTASSYSFLMRLRISSPALSKAVWTAVT